MINFAYFRNSNNGFYHCKGFIDTIFTRSSYFYSTSLFYLFDRNSGTGLSLNTLNNFTTGADNSTNKLFWYHHRYQSRCMRLKVRAWSRKCFLNSIKDIHTAFMGLTKCILKNFVSQSFHFNIHLSSSNTITSTCYLEIHISKMVFITEDITQYCIVLTHIF